MGWHHKINSIILNPKHKVKDVIQPKKGSKGHNRMYVGMELSMERKKRKREYVKMGKSIERTVHKYKETSDIKCCLKAISFFQKLE